MENQSERIEKIQHFRHPHSLMFYDEEQSDQSKEACCSACLELLLGRPSFSCGDCKFYLHKKCAEAPSEISHSPFHRKHPTLTLQLSSSLCDMCKEQRLMFYYCCTSCLATLDIKCALRLHNMDENFHELRYIGHEHPLTFIENPKDELKRAYCHWCQKLAVDSAFVCFNCNFYLHKKCAQFPSQLYHPSDRKHLLYLEDDRLVCSICQRQHWSLFYRCLPCNFDIDIECVQSRSRSIFECEKHSFTQLLRHDPFICDACGTEGNHVSYICSTCHIMIHEKCISLPRIIKATRHHHNIFHNYFFQKKDLGKHDCGICLSEVKIEYGNYKCLKQDCDFVSHVDCAREMGMYYIIDQVNDEDEESSKKLATNSSITCVIEMNQHEEATKIKHLSHEHVLTLGNKIKEDDDKNCDACMLSISTPFYYCSQCDFLLHKTCAELPRKKHHWFHLSLTTLNFGDFFQCARCNRVCSGFVYKSNKESHSKFCLRCARISHILICQGHEHSLFFDFKFKGQCNACGAICKNGVYRCKDCSIVALDFTCVTLPQAIRYKCDKHFLKLTFHVDNDDPEEYYCDICEEKREPNRWFYHCTVCNNSAHPKCVLGEYPFMKIKIGVTFPDDYHPHDHPLIFVKKNYDTCFICGHFCQDVALECKLCRPKYTFHSNCYWGYLGFLALW